jgi:hypothetical protein
MITKAGRPPTAEEIADLHCNHRAYGAKIRSAEQLLNDAASQLETKFNIRRRERDIEANRKRSIDDRIAQSRKAHGLPPPEPATPRQNANAVQNATPSEGSMWATASMGVPIDAPERAQNKSRCSMNWPMRLRRYTAVL